MKMEIKSDLLKKMLSNAFGFNIAQSNLLEAPSSKDESESKNDLAVVDEELKYRAGKRLLAEEINKQKNKTFLISLLFLVYYFNDIITFIKLTISSFNAVSLPTLIFMTGLDMSFTVIAIV